MAHSALHNLPAAVLARLDGLTLPDEPRADCDACPMACAPEALPENPRRFHEDARCCTYHPALANWMVGQILETGGPPADLIIARMADRDGVSADGICASRAHVDLRVSLGEQGFGRSISVRCPYWVGGELACGIWENRDAVCRSWFCKTEDGPRSVAVWTRLKSLLRAYEDQLRGICNARGEIPPDDASDAVLMDWYRQCARVVADLRPEEIADPGLDEVLESLVALQAELHQPLPPLLGAAIRDVKPVEGGMEMRGYSRWDPVVVPKTIFQLLGRLTGEIPWKQALAEANAALPEPLPEALVEHMYRRGVLRPLAGPQDLEVGGSVRIKRGEEARPAWMDELQERLT